MREQSGTGTAADLDHEKARKGTLAGFFGNVMKDLKERFGAWV
jgi:hypothetical protein